MMKLTTVALSALLAFGSFGASYRLSKDSQVKWLGKKVTGEHRGTVDFSSGTVEFSDDGRLTGGSFTMDMKSLSSTDLSGSSKKKLDDHLKSDDFFGVEKHGQARFVITGVEGGDGGNYKVTGDLTIKGKSTRESLDVRVSRQGDTAKAVGKLVFDRTKYDIRYNSGTFFPNIGDKAIDNDVELEFDISAEVAGTKAAGAEK